MLAEKINAEHSKTLFDTKRLPRNIQTRNTRKQPSCIYFADVAHFSDILECLPTIPHNEAT